MSSAATFYDNNGEVRLQGELAGGPVLTATVTLTDAQIKTLPTASVEIVPAPGANVAIMPVYGVIVPRFPDGVYAGGANDYFTIGTSTDGAEEMGATVVNITDDFVAPLLPSIASAATLGYTPLLIQAKSQLRNAALTISGSGSGNWTGGGAGNSLVVHVLYIVITV